MTTAVVDRERLRAQLGKLPTEAQTAVRDLFEASKWPRLTDEWDQADLVAACEKMGIAARDAGYEMWTTPLDLAPLKERIAALPDDLRDLAAENAKEAGVPTSRVPDLWTVAAWEKAEECVAHAEGYAAKRHRHVMAALGSLPATSPDETPVDARHRIVSIVTNGRTESSKKLTGPEARHLASWAETAALVPGTPLGAYAPDWEAEKKRLGLTLAELVARAKAFCTAHGLPGVIGSGMKALQSVSVDHKSATAPYAHRIIAHLLAGDIDDGETIMERTKPEADLMREHADDEPTPVALAPEALVSAAVHDVVEGGRSIAEDSTRAVVAALHEEHDALAKDLAEGRSDLVRVEEKLDALAVAVDALVGLVTENATRAAEALKFVAEIEAPLAKVLDRK